MTWTDETLAAKVAEVAAAGLDRQIPIPDTGLHGAGRLSLRVLPTGGRVWCIRYRLEGSGNTGHKHSRVTFGHWPEMGIDDAIAYARQEIGLVADHKRAAAQDGRWAKPTQPKKTTHRQRRPAVLETGEDDE